MIEDCKKAAPILIVWLGVSTIVYLYIYWSYFGVDPFGYVSFYEVLNYTGQYFLVAAGTAVAIGILETIFPGDDSKKYLESDKSIIRLVVAAALLIAIASVYLKNYWPSIAYLYYATAPVLAVWVSRTEMMKKYISNQPIRIACLIFIFVSPFSAVTESQRKAIEILHEESPQIINVRSEALPLNKQFTNIGKLGGWTFLKEIGVPKIYSVRTDEIKYIEYTLD